MSMIKTRSRQIAFRMSRDEYEKLCEFCVSTGARSISDLARSAICQVIGITTDGMPDPIAGRMQVLDFRIQQVDRKLDELTSLLKRDSVPRPVTEIGLAR